MRLTVVRLVAAAVLTAVPAVAQAAPAPAAPAKNNSPIEKIRKVLEEVGDMNYQNKSLHEIINDLKAKEIQVIIDPMVYQFGFNPHQPTITISLKQVKLKDGLQTALAPFNLKCGLTRDGLYISTEEGVITKQLRQRVSVDCDGTPFVAAVKQLAADNGVNIIVDPRLGEKANKAITIKLDDVTLESAVRLMAEVADLGTVRMGNVLFITTIERAEKLRPDSDGPTKSNNNQVFPFPVPIDPPDGPVPFPGGPPVIGVPGVILPAPGGGGIGGGEVVPPPPAAPQPAPAAPPAPAPEKPVEGPKTAPVTRARFSEATWKPLLVYRRAPDIAVTQTRFSEATWKQPEKLVEGPKTAPVAPQNR
ncbi:MAG: hypothetical protein RMJ56_14895 [Gemmataceae bacterium]|nr:hypothetical protein [Gemmata sp.]MDW8198883.1 hypothetical protein [Gemmataceae bacterium]